MTKLALGTVQFGLDYGIANDTGQVQAAQMKTILEMADNAGIHLLDTAAAYGDGELRLGQCGVNQFKVISKLPAYISTQASPSEWVIKHVQASLTQLQCDHLYAYLLHRPADLLGEYGCELFDTLMHLKQQRLIEHIGVSIYSPDALDQLFDRYPLGVVQAPLNIFDRRFLYSGWLQKLHEHGVEIHIRSAFLQRIVIDAFPVATPVFYSLGASVSAV